MNMRVYDRIVLKVIGIWNLYRKIVTDRLTVNLIKILTV